MQKLTFGTLLLCLCAFFLFKADRYEDATLKAEKEGVKAAVLDYVEALYEVDSTRIQRSVHPELHKRGYYFRNDAYQGPADMTYQQLVDLAGRWNTGGNQIDEDSPKDIEVFDVLDKTASAKLTAEWGVDYFHLVKQDNKWYIMNVLWQSPPRAVKQ